MILIPPLIFCWRDIPIIPVSLMLTIIIRRPPWSFLPDQNHLFRSDKALALHPVEVDTARNLGTAVVRAIPCDRIRGGIHDLVNERLHQLSRDIVDP